MDVVVLDGHSRGRGCVVLAPVIVMFLRLSFTFFFSRCVWCMPLLSPRFVFFCHHSLVICADSLLCVALQSMYLSPSNAAGTLSFYPVRTTSQSSGKTSRSNYIWCSPRFCRARRPGVGHCDSVGSGQWVRPPGQGRHLPVWSPMHKRGSPRQSRAHAGPSLSCLSTPPRHPRQWRRPRHARRSRSRRWCAAPAVLPPLRVHRTPSWPTRPGLL